MNLIDKSALVAEIERIKKEECPIDTYEGRIKLFYFERFLSFLNTLEMKEVDLGFQRFAKEMETVFALPSSKTKNTEEEPLNWEYAIAKHFFELGMQVSNKAQNIWHDANEKLPTGVIVVSDGRNLHIGWSTDEGDGIEDEHGRLITKTYQKWAREEDLT